MSNFLVASLSFYFHYCQSLEEHEETKEVSKRVQLLLKEETAAVQTKLVRNLFFFLFFVHFLFGTDKAVIKDILVTIMTRMLSDLRVPRCPLARRAVRHFGKRFI